ncbi:RagB/SusD family nutrient uptake outer membrane protein [Alistipes sp.]|uniref:RagB/SusD family nutrient uptake outer membrane protein n=1 Tax=Alistipes sp. TaxID=1872444 RepID=UPI0025B9A530|nr:RagB/SusD family nutrient uptake outer membrane protein [Alistipes sp.]
MKKNNILKTAALLLGSAVLLSGCIKETFPEGGYATSEQTTDSPFAQGGLITAMPTVLITNFMSLGEHIDFGYPGIFGATDRMAGEVFPVSGNLPGGNQYYDRWQAWLYPGKSTGLAANGRMSPFFYTNYYKFIFTANEAINAAKKIGDANEMMGIAKTFRALCYLDLARLYEALPAKAPKRPSYETELKAVEGLTVPIVREDTSMEQLENNPRVSREEIFKFIFEDLNAAETLLADYTPPTKNLPSLAVIYGLKARAYLWLGQFNESYADIPTGEAAYKMAAEYAHKAIEKSGCTILTENQWLDPKTGFNTVNSSWMWAMIQTTDTVLNNLLSWSAHMTPEAIWGYGYNSQPGISVFNYNRISEGDFRKKSFVGKDRSFKDIQPYTTLTEEEFKTIAAYASFKFHAANGEKRNYSTGNVTSIPIMRVEEMHLIQAEATAHYDKAAGKSLLQTFMSHRDKSYTVSVADDKLIEEIIFQKRIEFWGEGVILYDLKRLNMGMHNGKEGTNAPPGAKLSTEGRAPWWNCVFPLNAVQQNKALLGKNNPNPVQTVDESK